LVNSTNLASATWTAYASSNFSATLPDNDGLHTILVALRGRTTSFPPAWDETEFTLDRVAPVMIITNPVSATVTKPFLQLQGYSPEPLASLTYDVTNAAGLITNELAFVVDQYFDTNLLDYTTNYFQAFDVELTNGLNTITLSVADLAGNVTVTNVAVTLSYESVTNPPAFTPIWPTEGAEISGDNFTLRGTLDDESAAVRAWVNGDTAAAVTGIVERGGVLWAENLPLAGGSNVVTVAATNAAGLGQEFTVNVTKSAIALVVEASPTGESLYEPYGTVSGTISADGYTVTVNGVSASSLTPEGSVWRWTASAVPVMGKGTATFTATATRTGGGGGAGASLTVSSAVEKPAHIGLVEHHASTSSKSWDSLGELAGEQNVSPKRYQAQWEADASGAWRPTYNGTEHWYNFARNYGSSTTDYAWSDADPLGTYHASSGASGAMGTDESFDTIRSAPHREKSTDVDWIHHFYARNVRYEWQGATGRTKVDASARTELKLYTGGKAGVGRKSLIHIAAHAEEYGKPPAGGWLHMPSTAVDATKINVLGWWLFGRYLDSNGDLYRVLSDNEELNLNLRIPGVKHYNAEAQATRHQLVHETAQPALTATNRARTKLGVGEVVNFWFDPTIPNLVWPDILWSATAGSVENSGDGTAMSFTAPSNAATTQVTVRVKGTAMLTEKFNVVEPSGWDHTILTHTFPNIWTSGEVAVAMKNRVWIGPTDVSFYRVMISEFGEDADPVTGYFADTNKFTANPGYWFHHWPGAEIGNNYAWGPITPDNEIREYDNPDPGDTAGLAPTSSHPYTPPWSAGVIYVDIPVKWKVGDGPTNNLAHRWDQQITIDSSGTVTVEKFGQQTTRTVNDVVTPNIL
jgi:hypothetical protein